MSLDAFSERTRTWFEGAFAGPTAAQELAWPAIASGEHVLISAPTGSGKTLAAFLYAIDQLAQEKAQASSSRSQLAGDSPPGRIALVYVSPLKALSYDIDRNLRTPLRGIGADLKVAVRTGDTPQRERQQMLRDAPDILITTPESLYLMLTGQAQKLFEGVRWCIVDEIHAVASTKRGAHLALTLERLTGAAGSDVQRIGLSATQNPLEEVGRFMVGPQRRCRVVDTGVRKELDLQIHVPVESMVEPDAGVGGDRVELDPLAGGSEATRRSIWPAIYPELLALIRSHKSTILFVNNRRGAERLAIRLNDLAGEELARSHHGSLAREERTVVEEMLKAGELPCLVATSSLELGIDMGAVDLVIQVESPKSVARGLQRIGRAGHSVGDVSRGRIFPKFRADLLECAVVARRMREARIETTVVPRNALDVLAQQIVAIAAAAPDDEGEGGRAAGTVSVDDLYALVTRTHSYAELGRGSFENVLDMLDGRYPSSEFAELRPRIVWDRVAGTLRARPGARQLAVTNAGTIPDRGLFSVTLPDGRRVGELDEEMVYEARPGQTFLLGASTWRIEEIGRDRVIVTPAPGLPGAVPFWKGDTLGRPRELGEAIGAFARWAVDQPAEVLERDYDLDERAARNLVEFLAEQQQATRVVPSDRAIVVERFRDEIGDWRLCVLSPFGGRVHAAWSLALSARIRERVGLESDAIYSDDGIIIHLPDAEDPPGADLVLLEPDEIEELVVAELGSSALFGARFRENAARALLIPRARPGRRTPLWQQRLKSQSLLEVAKKYGEFPVILETYRECLRDVLDVPGLVTLLTALHRREITLVEVETPTASPFASSLLFDYVATYMYEGDTPNAERRAAALSLDRDLLRELLGQEELRDLIDPGALAQVEADLQCLSEPAQATGRDGLLDVLRRVGDLSVAEVAARVLGALDPAAMLDDLRGERRAARVRINGEERWIDAADAGLYRDALGAAPPGGLPAAFLEDVPDALRRLLVRFAATHGPFTTADVRLRYGIDASAALRELEREGALVRGELRPGGSEREWCDPEVLRRLRRASLAVLRKEIEPSEARELARFLPAWQGVDRHAASGAGIDRLREVLVPLQGLALPAEVWERDILPRRVGAYSPSWMDQLCAAGEVVWVGAGALGRNSGRVALYFREDLALLGPPPFRGEPPESEAHEAVRARLAAGACFFSDLLVDVELSPEEIQEALWDLAWAGRATNDAFAPLRAPRLTLARAQREQVRHAGRRSGGRFGAARRRGGAAAQVQGRWSLTEPLLAPDPSEADPVARRRAVGELLLERYGIVTREQVLAEGLAGGFSAIYPELSQLETLGVARRGYFLEGLGGAQFALPGAVERLRARPGTGAPEPPPLVLAAVDPAQPYGAALPWPKRGGQESTGRRPARVAGAYVVLSGGDPVVYLERGGRALQTLVDAGDARLRPALGALVDHVRSGAIKRVGLEKVDGEPAMTSSLAPVLTELGFQEGPRRLTLSA
ncbi:MAG TPA: DEAD/DEAH box helicase [Solirubrobacteraceae bacterium]|jgi:ATP-dependent Lhr-like helicase|nr:DEAD/DEAH box helicase [Solirubrobacteraceae bacterium]